MLLNDLFEQQNLPSIQINGLSNDSRRVVEGDCFFAYKGRTFDGNRFTEDAIRRGAVAVCSDRLLELPDSIPCIYVPELQRRQSHFAARFYDHPSKNLHCVGVTGTNGKTSVAYGLTSLLPKAGFAGSLGWGIPPDLCKTDLTTVDSILAQAGLAGFLKQGLTHAVMEVSSHALDQGRVDDVSFEVAVFTNLTREHLDYHGSMEEYGRCKSLLFRRLDLKLGVVNLDDPYSAQILRVLKNNHTPQLTYGRSERAMIHWSELRRDGSNLHGKWRTPWGEADFALPILAEYSLANCAAILACLQHFGWSLSECTERMVDLATPPGRLEFIQHSSGVNAVIDFAHTSHALENVLRALREDVKGRLICVFGCGGDRDEGKRSMMGKIAERYADLSIVTTDNPRFEDPEEIIRDIVDGFEHARKYVTETDRGSAIKLAFKQAGKDDLILIAGKGAEQFIEVQGQRIPFSDRTYFLQLGGDE